MWASLAGLIGNIRKLHDSELPMGNRGLWSACRAATAVGITHLLPAAPRMSCCYAELTDTEIRMDHFHDFDELQMLGSELDRRQ